VGGLMRICFAMGKPMKCKQNNNHFCPANRSSNPPPNPLGRHLIADFFGARYLHDPAFIKQALIDAAQAAGAKVLGSHIHDFGEGMGVTGVVTLAESHISIHSWPEHCYAAIDVFMCGDADPRVALNSLMAALQPSKTSIELYQRGEID
jgi:S-adenosylmethionine decarboxylase